MWVDGFYHCYWCSFRAEERLSHDCQPQTTKRSAGRPEVIMSSPPVAIGFHTPSYPEPDWLAESYQEPAARAQRHGMKEATVHTEDSPGTTPLVATTQAAHVYGFATGGNVSP